jgi:hypothetical protein
MTNHTVPPGFERCQVCGEFNGTTQAKYLTWEALPPKRFGAFDVPVTVGTMLQKAREEELSSRDPDRCITVVCLCKGPLCATCGVNHIHRPISNAYDLRSNTVSHWPYMVGMFPCRPCRLAQDKARIMTSDRKSPSD